MNTIILPPPEAPKVLQKEKTLYKDWILVCRNFPKVERLGIGNKIEQTFLEVLEFRLALSLR